MFFPPKTLSLAIWATRTQHRLLELLPADVYKVLPLADHQVDEGDLKQRICSVDVQALSTLLVGWRPSPLEQALLSNSRTLEQVI